MITKELVLNNILVEEPCYRKVISQSSCSMADSINKLFATLQNVERKLNDVILETKEAMEYAGVSFERADLLSAFDFTNIDKDFKNINLGDNGFVNSLNGYGGDK